jgi:hypothetical protein
MREGRHFFESVNGQSVVERIEPLGNTGYSTHQKEANLRASQFFSVAEF